ncbi:MAG: acetate--CoA ligase family protein [Proteobacteria bacterium]|nr:acetate--CoA ligase family protein [Pseudomonadota bacterium]
MTVRHLDRLFAPRSIAIVSAAGMGSGAAARIRLRLSAAAFHGPVRDIAIASGDLAAITPAEPSDLAIVCAQPAAVPGIIDALARAGTRAAIVIGGGFDADARRAMLEAARPHLLRIVGPGSQGVLVPAIGMAAADTHVAAAPGELAFVSQSNALTAAVLDWAAAHRIGFSHVATLGESADVDVADLLDYLASDPAARAILLYVESIAAARKFMSAARAAARNKPVIVVKAGRSAPGMAAAASHTGALITEDIVVDAAIRRAGMLRVDTLQQLFVAAQTLTRFRGNVDEELVVMANGGGPGVLAADAAARLDVPLHRLDDATRSRLDAPLPANPIALAGDAPPERHAEVLRLLLAQRDNGALLFLHAPHAGVDSAAVASACAPIVRTTRSRVLACWLGDASADAARRMFDEAGAADYATPEAAVEAYAMLRSYRRNQALLTEAPAAGDHATPDLALARTTIAAALAAGRAWLDEAEAKAVLRACGIPAVATVAVPPDPQAAAAAARRCGFPVALKIRSPDVAHKSEVGGVRLGLADAAAVRRAAEEMRLHIASCGPEVRIDGYTVQPMVQRRHARELIVGAAVDPVFGPVVVFGHGGTAVEAYADRAVALPPLNRTLAREVVSRTHVQRLLAAFGEQPAAQLEAIHDVLVAVSQMLADLPEMVELDINPLWADERGVIALDARIRIAPATCAGTDRFAIRPYPAALAQRLDWRGSVIEIRPIRPEDQAQHAAFIRRISAEDMRTRFFFGGRRELPPAEMARLVQIDYAREMAFIATRTDADGACETLGAARAISDPDNVEAEFALLVRSDLKRLGLGRLLLGRIIDYLRSQGTRRVCGDVLLENLAMRALVEALGFSIHRHPDDPGLVRCELDLTPTASRVAGGDQPRAASMDEGGA